MARKSGKRTATALNFLLSAFAGAATAFAVFALPDWRFQQAVEMSGLPLILSAAQPPLGLTARLAVMAVAGAGAFFLIWLVLRALDKPAKPRKAKPVEVPEAPIRLRRADMHPDAPAFRPLSAGADLGEPAARPADRRTVEELADALTAQDEVFELEAFELEEEQAAFMEASDPSPVQQTDHGHTSIPHLMQRLELGLLRRERQLWPAPSRDAPAPEPERTSALDERLRDAIDDLQKLAARPV